MGSLRRGLILALAPGAALAEGEACALIRPGWDGGDVSAFSEAVALFGTPISLVLILASFAVIRFKSQLGAALVCLGWSTLASVMVFFDPTGGVRTAAASEGCIGSPVLFVTGATVLCLATLYFTGLPDKNDEPGA